MTSEQKKYDETSFIGGWDAAIEALRNPVDGDAPMRRAADYLAENRPRKIVPEQ